MAARRTPPATPAARYRRQAQAIRQQIADLRAQRAAALAEIGKRCKAAGSEARKAIAEVSKARANRLAWLRKDLENRRRVACPPGGEKKHKAVIAKAEEAIAQAEADTRDQVVEEALIVTDPTLIPVWREIAPEVDATAPPAEAIKILHAFVAEAPEEAAKAIEASGEAIAAELEAREGPAIIAEVLPSAPAAALVGEPGRKRRLSNEDAAAVGVFPIGRQKGPIGEIRTALLTVARRLGRPLVVGVSSGGRSWGTTGPDAPAVLAMLSPKAREKAEKGGIGEAVSDSSLLGELYWNSEKGIVGLGEEAPPIPGSPEGVSESNDSTPSIEVLGSEAIPANQQASLEARMPPGVELTRKGKRWVVTSEDPEYLGIAAEFLRNRARAIEEKKIVDLLGKAIANGDQEEAERLQRQLAEIEARGRSLASAMDRSEDARKQQQQQRREAAPAVAKISLVGCGKSKLDRPAPARELYTGQLFRAQLAYAQIGADAVYILSAFYGLLPLDREISPYDRKLSDLSKAEKERWGERVASSLLDAEPSKRLEITFFAGQDYVDFAKAAIRVEARRRGVDVIFSEPLRGMSQGARLRFFKVESEDKPVKEPAPEIPARDDSFVSPDMSNIGIKPMDRPGLGAEGEARRAIVSLLKELGRPLNLGGYVRAFDRDSSGRVVDSDRKWGTTGPDSAALLGRLGVTAKNQAMKGSLPAWFGNSVLMGELVAIDEKKGILDLGPAFRRAPVAPPPPPARPQPSISLLEVEPPRAGAQRGETGALFGNVEPAPLPLVLSVLGVPPRYADDFVQGLRLAPDLAIPRFGILPAPVGSAAASFYEPAEPMDDDGERERGVGRAMALEEAERRAQRDGVVALQVTAPIVSSEDLGALESAAYDWENRLRPGTPPSLYFALSSDVLGSPQHFNSAAFWRGYMIANRLLGGAFVKDAAERGIFFAVEPPENFRGNEPERVSPQDAGLSAVQASTLALMGAAPYRVDLSGVLAEIRRRDGDEEQIARDEAQLDAEAARQIEAERSRISEGLRLDQERRERMAREEAERKAREEAELLAFREKMEADRLARETVNDLRIFGTTEGDRVVVHVLDGDREIASHIYRLPNEADAYSASILAGRLLDLVPNEDLKKMRTDAFFRSRDSIMSALTGALNNAALKSDFFYTQIRQPGGMLEIERAKPLAKGRGWAVSEDKKIVALPMGLSLSGEIRRKGDAAKVVKALDDIALGPWASVRAGDWARKASSMALEAKKEIGDFLVDYYDQKLARRPRTPNPSPTGGDLLERCGQVRQEVAAMLADGRAVLERLAELRRVEIVNARVAACEQPREEARRSYDARIAKLTREAQALEAKARAWEAGERSRKRGELPTLDRGEQDALIEGAILALAPELSAQWSRDAQGLEGAGAVERFDHFLRGLAVSGELDEAQGAPEAEGPEIDAPEAGGGTWDPIPESDRFARYLTAGLDEPGSFLARLLLAAPDYAATEESLRAQFRRRFPAPEVWWATVQQLAARSIPPDPWALEQGGQDWGTLRLVFAPEEAPPESEPPPPPAPAPLEPSMDSEEEETLRDQVHRLEQTAKTAEDFAKLAGLYDQLVEETTKAPPWLDEGASARYRQRADQAKQKARNLGVMAASPGLRVSPHAPRLSVDRGRLLVRSDWLPTFSPRAKNLGGRWEGTSRSWSFDLRDRDRVEALLDELYGSHGQPIELVDVEVQSFGDLDNTANWVSLGRVIASRRGRDNRVELSEGVTLLRGSFPPRGGSRNNPTLDPAEGTWLLVRDAPRSLAEKEAAKDPEYYKIRTPNPSGFFDRVRGWFRGSAKVRDGGPVVLSGEPEIVSAPKGIRKVFEEELEGDPGDRRTEEHRRLARGFAQEVVSGEAKITHRIKTGSLSPSLRGTYWIVRTGDGFEVWESGYGRLLGSFDDLADVKASALELLGRHEGYMRDYAAAHYKARTANPSPPFKVWREDGKVKFAGPYVRGFVLEATRLGGRWNGSDHFWFFEPEQEAQVRALVDRHYRTENPSCGCEHAEENPGHDAAMMAAFALPLIPP